MKSKLLLVASLATLLVACSKDSESIEGSNPIEKGNTEVAAQQPVTFGAYVNRATTRAGDAGVLKLEQPAAGAVDGEVYLRDKGFGVFAYYTDDDQYSPIYQPNFMYNTKVSGANWAYSPLRYWPNEFGANAASEGVDRLSFFAYAPWVEATPTTGDVTGDNTYGIVGLSRNGATGDPFVKYYASLDPSKQVDFCWGVNTTTGKPNIDMTRPAVSDKVEFQFNHALAALNVQVDAAFDELAPDTKDVDANTKIYVRSVTFEGFVTKGAFNLNTDKATWYDLAGANYVDGGSVTIYDGRTNGREAQSESPNEAPVGLNPVIVQSELYYKSDGTPNENVKKGVTKTPVNLFGNATTATSPNAPVYVIPSSQPLSVTIVYDVETKNEKLSTYLSDRETHGTSVENKITKTITFGTGATASNKLEAGKQYNLTLHLGMTTVKFEAEVTDWPDDGIASSTNLPDNIGTNPGPGPGPSPTTVGYFRGYDVSKGLLMRDNGGNYSLTSGTNQLEILDYYGNDASKNTYYFQWTMLKGDSELGSDANDDLKADSEKLPDDWCIPSDTGWNQIIFGEATDITINNQSVTYGYALVKVSTGNHSGIPALFLIPDGATIELESLEGLEDYFNEEDGDYGYDEISLSSSDYDYLIGKNCRFLPISGIYDNIVNHKWKDGMDDYYPSGYYLCNNSHSLNHNQIYHLWVDYDDGWVYVPSDNQLRNDYSPVRLVKKMVP